MADETEISNIALGILGAEPITSYEHDETTRAKLCRSFYPTSRDATLRAYPWNFAVVRRSLSLDPTAPIFGYDNKFSLPANPYCLRVLELDDPDIDWKIEGRFLLCDSSAVMIKFISRVENTALFDSMFVQALATRLAAILSKPITGSADAGLWQLYASMVQEGKTIDGMEGTHDRWISDELVNVRY